MGHERRADVMRDRQIARFDLERGNPRVLRESAGNDRGGPLDDVARRTRGHAELRSSDDDVGRQLPAIRGPFKWRRCILRIAFRRAGVHPLRDRVDVGLLERPIVGKGSVLRIGEPRRHLAGDDSQFHRARPRPGLFVGQQRHRRDLARPMTRLTILLQDRKDVPGECDRSAGRILRLCRPGGDQHAHHDENQKDPSVAQHTHTPRPARLRFHYTELASLVTVFLCPASGGA